MAEVHVNVGPVDASGTKIVFHNPGVQPLPPGAGQPVTQATNSNGQTVISGQVPNSSVVFNSPA